jgi:hypothetical protein
MVISVLGGGGFVFFIFKSFGAGGLINGGSGSNLGGNGGRTLTGGGGDAMAEITKAPSKRSG